MSNRSFVHLHVHTHYSLLDGATRIKSVVERAKAEGMPAAAITDHGNLFGAVEFYTAALQAGIKPIIGMEAYLAPRQRTNREAKCVGGDHSYHLLLLAQNLTGYRNLLKLASIGYLEGFYYKPRIDKEVLAEFSDGLICTSTCLGAELPQMLLHRDRKEAKEAAEAYLKIFGPERFFIEVQDHGIPEQEQTNPELFDLAQRLGLGVIVTNDVHYLDPDDVEAHDVLCCIATNSRVADEDRFKFPSDQFYFKSGEEMAGLFPDHPEVLDNTLRIADMCDLELDFSKRWAPVYVPPDEKTDNDYLREQVYEGAGEKYDPLTDEVRERIDYELQVISSKGFSSYFLICWDLVKYARSRGIPCGARGSGCSSVVSYCLGISAPDPLRYGLYFERFMDPDRDEMPDIDIDMCQDGRQEVIDYVRKKYGHVAQIITFGTLKARAAVKDVSRVMGVDFERAHKITQLIPAELKMTIDRALEMEPELRRLCDEDETIRKIIDISKRIEGLARHAGVHAAGVVVADIPLDTLLPLYKAPGHSAGGQDQVVTQFDGPTVEKVGLLKMDFLGLRTLTTLERARQLAQRNRDVRIDFQRLDLTDQKVYELFARGQTKGIFQFESEGMRDVIRKMRPNRIEDLIAANALYRPGPMVNIEAYIARKHGEKWTTPHPLMSEVLEETFGIMVYQEQVSRLVNRLGGIELKEAFRLVKAISKKKTDMIEAMREPFVKGCEGNGLARATAETIFEDILRFGGYAFNKAHSTGYALIAFQTAYMKTYYPIEFMAALLTFEMSNTEKIVEYIEACRQMGIAVKPPDINISDYDFTPVYDKRPPSEPRAPATGRANAECGMRNADAATSAGGQIRFGLGAIKGLGQKAAQAIMEARSEGDEFKNIFDFCDRVDLSAVSKNAVEALIKCGAFDRTGAMRKALTMVCEKAVDAGQRNQRDKQSGQMSLLDMMGGEEPPVQAAYPRIPDDEQWTEAELLAFEKEVLGFYITNHPLAQHAEIIRRFATMDSQGFAQAPEGHEIIIGGMVTKLRTKLTRSGRSPGAKMGFMTLEDTAGSIPATLFPSDLEKYHAMLELDSIVFLRGTVERRREEPSLRVSEVVPLAQAQDSLTSEVLIKLSSRRHAPDIVERLDALFRKHHGDKPVVLRIKTSNDYKVGVRCSADRAVVVSDDFCNDVVDLLGPDSYELCGAAGAARRS